MRTSSHIQRGSGRLPRLTLLMAFVAIGLFVLFGPAPEGLVYERNAIGHGEWWRLLSGHFVHSDNEHALWDILALLLIGTLLERHSPGQFMAATIAGVVAVTGWIWWGMPELARYCGLSGIVNTLLAVLLIELWRKNQPGDSRPSGDRPATCRSDAPAAKLALLTGIGMLGKILVEIHLGQALFTDTAWPSVPSVHLAGVVGAMAWIGISTLWTSNG